MKEPPPFAPLFRLRRGTPTLPHYLLNELY
jgi:hypothetical protein